MARNRRKVEGEVTYSWIAVRLLLFVLVVGVLLEILFVKNRNLKLGDELRTLEREVQIAQERTGGLKAQLTYSKTPRELENKLTRWNLGMIRPSEGQIRRLVEPSDDTDGVIRPRILVQADSYVRRPGHP